MCGLGAWLGVAAIAGVCGLLMRIGDFDVPTVIGLQLFASGVEATVLTDGLTSIGFVVIGVDGVASIGFVVSGRVSGLVAIDVVVRGGVHGERLEHSTSFDGDGLMFQPSMSTRDGTLVAISRRWRDRFPTPWC